MRVTVRRTIWIIAGESSGDAYGAQLARELCDLDPGLCVRGMGGEAMAAAGVEIMVDASELGIVGLVEVVKHLPTFVRILRRLTQRAAAERPAAVVLIDYPGFNLRFARRLHRLGIKVVYYVSPQVWAWGQGRVPRIAQLVDKMLVIFPFETDVYAGTGLDVEFVGHPLLETLAAGRNPELAREPDTVLLLPGSRMAEVNRLLPVMLETAAALRRRRPRLRFVVAVPRQAMAGHVAALLRRFGVGAGRNPHVDVVVGQTRAWLQRATVGIAASGTVTVEAAILGLPLVVVYRLHWFTCWLAQRLVKLPFFTMVNLVAGSQVFEEFLQGAVHPANLVRAVEAILPGGDRAATVATGMAAMVEALGGQESAGRRAAGAVLGVAGGRPEPALE